MGLWQIARHRNTSVSLLALTGAVGLAACGPVEPTGGGAAGAPPQVGTGGSGAPQAGATGVSGQAGATAQAGSGAGGAGPVGGGSSGGAPAGGSGGSGNSSSGAGGGGGSGGSVDPSTLGKFSFFVTSMKKMQELSGSPDGFGGDLRYGTGDGLLGADKIASARVLGTTARSAWWP